MRPKHKSNLDLPPRMLRRVRKRRDGTQWDTYYYNGRDENGNRTEIPLGSDLDIAKMEWAKLERKKRPISIRKLGDLFDRYERDIIPAKKPATQRCNMLCLKQLRPAFADAPVESITPQVIAQYRDTRSAKVRANREIALLSHIFNLAREWGVTEKENPVAGVRKNRERPREFYATEEVWNAVYNKAVPELKDAMDLAYLTGQRPADVLRMRATDLVGEHLLVAQGKTSKKLRIQLVISGERTALGKLTERLVAQRLTRGIRNPYLVLTEDGRNVTAPMLRLRFDEARRKAATEAIASQDAVLAGLVSQFQFRDIRPKAASEIEDLTHASRLLGHSDRRITETVYRRVGEIVKPTR